MVVEPQPVPIKRSKLLASELHLKGFGSVKTMSTVLVNRTRSDIVLNISQVEQILGYPAVMGFPPVVEQAYRASERAVPLTNFRIRSPSPRQWTRIASPEWVIRCCSAVDSRWCSEVRDRPDVATIEKALSSFEPEAFFGPWVSEQDRSPVRRVGTKNIVRIVTNAALTLAEQAALQGERAGFDRWMAYARELENGSELGPVFGDRIRQLEEKGIPPRP